jgi:hypothetical protein
MFVNVRSAIKRLITIFVGIHNFLVYKLKTSRLPGGLRKDTQLTTSIVSTSWLSFGTGRRRDVAPSHFERGLNPARPGLSLGIFRRFGTMAYFHAVASPNEVRLSSTLYYRIKIESRKKEVEKAVRKA